MKNDKSTFLILCLFRILPVVWLGLLVNHDTRACPRILTQFPAAMEPFHIGLCGDWSENCPHSALRLRACGGCDPIFPPQLPPRTRNTVQPWGSCSNRQPKYRAAVPGGDNKIFTQNVRMGLDGRKHRPQPQRARYWRRRHQAKRDFTPNQICMWQHELYRALTRRRAAAQYPGHLLRQKGLPEVRVLDLLNMEKATATIRLSTCGTTTMCNGLANQPVQSTTPKGSQSTIALLGRRVYVSCRALILSEIRSATRQAELSNGHADAARQMCGRIWTNTPRRWTSCFERLEMQRPDHIAVILQRTTTPRQRQNANPFQITLAARLEIQSVLVGGADRYG